MKKDGCAECDDLAENSLTGRILKPRFKIPTTLWLALFANLRGVHEAPIGTEGCSLSTSLGARPRTPASRCPRIFQKPERDVQVSEPVGEADRASVAASG